MIRASGWRGPVRRSTTPERVHQVVERAAHPGPEPAAWRDPRPRRPSNRLLTNGARTPGRQRSGLDPGPGIGPERGPLQGGRRDPDPGASGHIRELRPCHRDHPAPAGPLHLGLSSWSMVSADRWSRASGPDVKRPAPAGHVRICPNRSVPTVASLPRPQVFVYAEPHIRLTEAAQGLLRKRMGCSQERPSVVQQTTGLTRAAFEAGRAAGSGYRPVVQANATGPLPV